MVKCIGGNVWGRRADTAVGRETGLAHVADVHPPHSPAWTLSRRGMFCGGGMRRGRCSVAGSPILVAGAPPTSACKIAEFGPRHPIPSRSDAARRPTNPQSCSPGGSSTGSYTPRQPVDV